MSSDRIARVQYYPQQFLRTTDFNAEQAYHVEMRRRHNVAHHIWGVVYGLAPRVEEDGLFLQPGVAVDGFGRELVLPERYRIPLSEFDAKDSERLDVWLLYNRRGSDPVPPGYGRCDPRTQAEFYRWQELPAVRLERPDPNYPDPRRPKAVAEAGIESVPYRRPPDRPEQRWPVFLGRVLRDRSDPEQPVYSVDLVGRPVAGLVGDVVVSPSRRAVVTVGSKIQENGDGSREETGRFSVALRHGETLTEHLRIEDGGEVDLHGRTRLHGDLTVAGGTIRFEAAAADAANLPACETVAGDRPTDHAKPWRIYRYRCSRGAPGTLVVVEQLRIEMAGQSSGPAEVAVGAWSAEEKAFKPILTVDNQETVTVHGDLVVKGSIRKDVEATAARLTPDARNFLLSTFSSGVGGANLQLQKFYRSPFGGQLDLDTEAGRQAAVDYLATDSNRLSDFIDRLLGNASARSSLLNKLLSTDANRRALLDRMPDGSLALDGFVDLLGDPAYADRLPAFAGGLVSTEDGQRAVIEALPDGSAELSDFAELARDDFPAWLQALLTAVQGTASGANTVAQALLAQTMGRQAAADQLITNPSWLTEVLDEFSADNGARVQVADRLLAHADGPGTVGDRLVADTSLIDDLLAPVLADPAARNVLAGLLVAVDERRRAILDALPDGSAELNAFAGLLTESLYSNRLDEFITHLLATAAGRTTAGNDLVADSTRLDGILSPVLADTGARGVLAGLIVAPSDGRRAILDALPSGSAELIAFAGLLQNSTYADRLDEFCTQILATNGGRTAVADHLEANDPPRSEFGDLINGADPANPDYPGVKGAICV